MNELLIEAAADFGRRLVVEVGIRGKAYGVSAEELNAGGHRTLMLETFNSLENNPFESYEQYQEAIRLSSQRAGLLMHERIHATLRLERAGWLPVGSGMQSRVYTRDKELIRTDWEHPEGILP